MGGQDRRYRGEQHLRTLEVLQPAGEYHLRPVPLGPPGSRHDRRGHQAVRYHPGRREVARAHLGDVPAGRHEDVDHAELLPPQWTDERAHDGPDEPTPQRQPRGRTRPEVVLRQAPHLAVPQEQLRPVQGQHGRDAVQQPQRGRRQQPDGVQMHHVRLPPVQLGGQRRPGGRVAHLPGQPLPQPPACRLLPRRVVEPDTAAGQVARQDADLLPRRALRRRQLRHETLGAAARGTQVDHVQDAQRAGRGEDGGHDFLRGGAYTTWPSAAYHLVRPAATQASGNVYRIARSPMTAVATPVDSSSVSTTR